MQTKTSITLLMLFCSPCIVHRCESSSTNNPTKQFYDAMHARPILTYQCYHNGSTIDPPGSINFTILWDGTDRDTTEAEGFMWSAKKGMPDSYTRNDFQTHYDTASGVGKLTTSTVQEDLTVLEPFKGQALYLKIVLTSQDNTVVDKIYDVDFECRNAKKLLKKVCPDPCNLVLTREL
ncbi:unnamed protein product [Ixodes hexagonus]